jgi:hypothetical protein
MDLLPLRTFSQTFEKVCCQQPTTLSRFAVINQVDYILQVCCQQQLLRATTEHVLSELYSPAAAGSPLHVICLIGDAHPDGI